MIAPGKRGGIQRRLEFRRNMLFVTEENWHFQDSVFIKEEERLFGDWSWPMKREVLAERGYHKKYRHRFLGCIMFAL